MFKKKRLIKIRFNGNNQEITLAIPILKKACLLLLYY